MKKEYEYIGKCTGNNGNGCFMDSSGHHCGCFTRVLKKSKQERIYSEEDMIDFGLWLYLEVGSGNVKERTNEELFNKWLNKLKK